MNKPAKERILVTGAAGFIGSALSLRLLERGDEVIGIDNHNDYYDPALKEARLARHADHPDYTHLRMDLADREKVAEVFADYRPARVVNLAAQAGVRYSLENPLSYVDSNLLGFVNVLEGCRHNGIEHLVYASSSSVYGANTRMPFSVHHNVDHPVSLYAATKKANELMAHTYSHLYGLPTTGLRFFTVYGPWDRPDMAHLHRRHRGGSDPGTRQTRPAESRVERRRSRSRLQQGPLAGLQHRQQQPGGAGDLHLYPGEGIGGEGKEGIPAPPTR